MEVSSINDLLKRYQSFLPQGRALKQSLEESLRACGTVSPIGKASLQGSVLYVNAHPTVKQYIFLNKEKIIGLFNQKSKLAVADIV